MLEKRTTLLYSNFLVMEVGAFLRELGEYIKLGELKLDDKGVCSLVFDETLVVHIEPSPDRLFLHVYAPINSFSKNTDKMQTLLEANLFGNQTAGAAFGYHAPTDSIFLTLRLWLDRSDFYGLRTQLEAFVDRVEFWKGQLGS